MANEKWLIDLDDIFPNKCFYVNRNDPEKSLDELISRINNAPTVEAVEVVHARWENVQNGKGCCSNCNRLDSIDNLATHCRYCGARMDGDGNV